MLSFDQLYADEVPYVWRALRRLGVAPSAVEDAVQDVFVAVHRRLGDFEGRSSVRTWLFGFALRVARDHRRRARRKGGLVPLNEELPAVQPGPLEHAERSERLTLLRAILDTMDDDRREVFVLMELEQLRAPEVAELLSMRLTTVHARLRTARRHFEHELRRRRAMAGER